MTDRLLHSLSRHRHWAARDASAIHASIKSRAMKVETTMPWKLRRLKSNTIVRMLYRLSPNRFLKWH